MGAIRLLAQSALAVGTIVGGVCGVTYITDTTSSERNGTYREFNAQTFYEGNRRKVILFSKENRHERLIATDFDGRDNFESIEFLFVPDSSPLRKYTSRDIQEAWETVRKDK